MAHTVPGSEAELLRMPKRDYMNQAQLAFFKRQLLELKEETQTAIEQTKKAIATEGNAADELDRAASEEENRQRMRFAERRYYLLRKIDQALGRIYDGDYGYCEETGEPIGLRRLLLRPTASLCIDAKGRQEEMERNFQKHRG